jgi:ubiquinone/menaquinone biosynthesis C-methylase UbiE
MRVLDIGCGIGDVSKIVAELVGTSGSVSGVDRDEAALFNAGERAVSAGYVNITFVRRPTAASNGIPKGQFLAPEDRAT